MANDEISFAYLNDVVLAMELKPESYAGGDIPGYVWVLTYNAQDDSYETAWAGPGLNGLTNDSKLKIESNDGDNYVLMEEMEVDGDEYVARHEIQAQEDSIQWVIYQGKKGQDLRKIVEHDMSRQDKDLAE